MDTTITIRVDKAWLAKIDKWREKQPVPPGRSELIRLAVERFISKERAK
jgi:metal-responsive CopG/Arc/MetJ family transcriptional regulator